MPARKRPQTPFDFWISFSPMAPLFGVEWRFEKMIPGAQFFRPMEVVAQMTAASVEEVARATEKGSHAVVEAAEAVVENAAQVEAQIEAEVIDEAAEEMAEVVAAAPDAKQSVVAAEPDAAPSSPRPPKLYDAAPVDSDDLKLIKGVGPKLEAMLNAMGIYRFEQIAGFSDANLAWVDENLTAFKGRPFRDDWVAQARALL